ncbi:MAG: hypothetical protein CM15mP17_11770 [Gammaproteobacteria bacterium]|nr:MAG: hypothetical protein CM15mP17_11770 [Gammaproteobacteria bacterium]
MKCLPAIDILDGKCVRLTKGDFDKSKIYNESPLDQAKIFENAGFKEIHIVDLNGAKSGNRLNLLLSLKLHLILVLKSNWEVAFGPLIQ